MTLRMPAEFGVHERTVMCWPARDDLYGDLIGRAEAAHALVANTIGRFEPVSMIAPPGAAAERARTMCADVVEVAELPIDDSWFRDTGPIYVTGPQGRIATDWTFNGWGEKFTPFADDDRAAARWAQRCGHPVRRIPMVLEGGSVVVDGEGTLLTTTQCLMHPNRNPAMSRAEIERQLIEELGATTVIWLPYGLIGDDDTDGHVDNVAAFVRPGLVLVQGCDDPAEEDWLRMNVDARWLRGTLDAAGRVIDVVQIPVLPFAEIGGKRRAVPYANLYIGNGFVIVPTVGHPADGDVLALIGAQFPGREVVGLDVGEILAFGGGGIHCITQQVPAT